jgi:hypothetical protein
MAASTSFLTDLSSAVDSSTHNLKEYWCIDECEESWDSEAKSRALRVVVRRWRCVRVDGGHDSDHDHTWACKHSEVLGEQDRIIDGVHHGGRLACS